MIAGKVRVLRVSILISASSSKMNPPGNAVSLYALGSRIIAYRDYPHRPLLRLLRYHRPPALQCQEI